MTGRGKSAEGEAQRFNVQLLIVHPTIDPAEITATLGLQPIIVHRAGTSRMTPAGTSLPGRYPDTRWRYSIRHEVKGQWFRREMAALLDRLDPHKTFLAEVRATGGKAAVMLQFLGDDGYFGDELGRDLLARLVDLQLDFGIEVFTVPQA